MCGIYGRVGPRQDDLDRRATLSLRHRGPDDAGLLVDPQGPDGETLVLGQTRLSILDLSPAGHQPMRSADGNLALAFNGEIFNFLELRRELEEQGRVFQSHSDTEVILHLYALHGDAMLSKLEGMYAIALWDAPRRRLLLARDPAGIKPLFYRTQPSPDRLAFSSEIKALLVDPKVSRDPCLPALAGYLTYLYVPPPGSAFVGIERLAPGHKLVLQGRHITVQRFHRFQVQPKHTFVDVADATQQLEALLLHVVGQHMLADVPVGAFLSGGIDSGLLVAMMARQKRERGDIERVRTFTVGFGQEGRRWDEVDRAAALARYLDVDHEVVRIAPEAAAERFGFVAQQFDEPFANPTALVHDVLCEGARRHVTVALAGDGGDEAFAGYPRHRATQLLALWQTLPRSVREQGFGRIGAWLPERAEGVALLRQARRFLCAGGGDFGAMYRDWLTYYPPRELQALLTAPALAALGGAVDRDLGQTEDAVASLGPDFDPLDAACYADIAGFLPNNVLQESDRISMRHALEVRVPFADRRVLDFGLRLPHALKMSPAAMWTARGRGASKRVLREVAARYLPDEVVTAPKQGFGAPMGAWLAGPLRSLLEEATRPEVIARRGLVRPEAVAALRAEHLAGKRDRTWNLWALVVLESWFAQRVDRLDLPDVQGAPVRVEVMRRAESAA